MEEPPPARAHLPVQIQQRRPVLFTLEQSLPHEQQVTVCLARARGEEQRLAELVDRRALAHTDGLAEPLSEIRVSSRPVQHSFQSLGASGGTSSPAVRQWCSFGGSEVGELDAGAD